MNWLKPHRNDLFLVAALLILGGALALYLHATRQTGGYVSVQAEGTQIMELPLSENRRLTLGSGEHINLLVIENGTAQVVEASCPDQVCVRQGAIQYAGESIVCLPHRLVVTVESGRENGVDATAR